MKVTCPQCGNEFVVNAGGRPKVEYPVQNVLDAYQRLQSVSAVAEELGIPKGSVWRILKQHYVEIRRARRELAYSLPQTPTRKEKNE